MSLTALATVKQFLRISHTAEDTALQVIIDAAEAWIADRAGIHLCADAATAYESKTEDLDGGGLYLWPTYLPVRAITSILDRMDDDEAVDVTEYALAEYATRIERWGDTYEDGSITTWDLGRKRYRVTYTAGYLASDIPDTFTRAVFHYVYRDYHGRDAENSGLYSPEHDAALVKMIAPLSLRRIMA
jgi:uncharacterized phiE125 gp8 family phage protein